MGITPVEPYLGQIVTIGVFLAAQWLSHMKTTSAIEADGKVLKAHMENMQKEMSGMQTVLSRLADVHGRIDTMQQVNLLQGKRVDDLQTRINQLMDREQERQN